MIETFIKRPVLSLVISIIITLLGLLALYTLPITQFPDIVPPSVVVTAKYNGANAEVCTKAVAIPLERAINGVPNMTYMNSVSSNNGTTLIQVNFKVGTDPDLAAVNVQNRVLTVMDELPTEVIKAGVTTEKEVNSILLYLNIYSNDTSFDEDFIYNFTDINILHELKRIDGVGFAEIMGAKDYSMRIWLKPERMMAYSISTTDIIEALKNQNIEAAPGKIGESSGKQSQDIQYILKYTGKFNTPVEYEDIVIKSDAYGQILKLKDVASIEFGAFSYGMVSKTDGKPSASILLKQRPGSNAKQVIKDIKAKMEEMQKTTFPPNLKFNYAYDVSRFLDASIHEVLRTLIEAFILVFIVVFIFLQNFRATLIPSLAVPVALIGTFAFMQMLGFSINLLTLFALVLAIGIVVDNAIVVVEAVHDKMINEHLSAYDATIAAMKEISGAIIAITLVMTAVFVPVAFLSGPVGVFYRQFSLTLAIAIGISGLNALTLTPALCALLLKHNDETKTSMLDPFFKLFNKQYAAGETRYKWTVRRFVSRKWITYSLLAVFYFATWGISRILPTGFIPTEDQAMIYANVITPSGSTVERTDKVMDEIEAEAKKINEVENVTILSGYSLMTESPGASYAMAMINLKPWDKRSDNIALTIEKLKKATKHLKDAQIEFLLPPTVPGFGNASGFELRLLDKTGIGDVQKTAKVTKMFIDSLQKSPKLMAVFTNFEASFPQYMIHFNQNAAAQKGVNVENAMSTLETYVGSSYATNFIRFAQMYKVLVQAHPSYRAKPDDILNLYVKNNKGEMVPFSSFITLEKVYGPEQITRFNMYTSALITGDAAKGLSSGDAITEVEKIAKIKLPRGYDIAWSGITREQIIFGDQAIYIFLLCIVFVYLVLSAQYESFIMPLPVLISIPSGIFGSYLFLKLLGLENNIYTQVALIMLIGLLGKNAILIVEFASQRQRAGMSILLAAQEGAAARLRPILMTSFAFIAGLIPLCIASGAGAIGNRSIGIAAVGGMLIGTLFGVLIVPGLYVIFASLSIKKSKKHPTN